jgi:hypothetical protein
MVAEGWKMKWVGGVLWQCNFGNPGQSAATTPGAGQSSSCPARAGSAKERHAAPCPAAVSGSGPGDSIPTETVWTELDTVILELVFFVHHLFMAQTIPLLPELMR